MLRMVSGSIVRARSIRIQPPQLAIRRPEISVPQRFKTRHVSFPLPIIQPLLGSGAVARFIKMRRI